MTPRRISIGFALLAATGVALASFLLGAQCRSTGLCPATATSPQPPGSIRYDRFGRLVAFPSGQEIFANRWLEILRRRLAAAGIEPAP
jgi:hypothetical protein